jgi:uncharacterized membrane protein YoaK (UPF0700 family)
LRREDRRVLERVSSIDELSQAIAHATAPAFMLGAVAGFLSILFSRLQRIADRIRSLRGADVPRSTLNGDAVAILERRAGLLNRAIYCSVLSALSTAALLIVAFACAMFGIEHRTGTALMFVIALALLMGSLVELTREVRLTMKWMHLD